MFLSEWREFPSAPCLAVGKKLMKARVSMLLKSRASLTCFWACFLPGRAKDLSAPRYLERKVRLSLPTLNPQEVGIQLARLGLPGADKSLARPGRKEANVSVRMAWISFGALPCRKQNLMTACVSMLLKSRASMTCFRSCFLPGRAKDLSAPRY